MITTTMMVMMTMKTNRRLGISEERAQCDPTRLFVQSCRSWRSRRPEVCSAKRTRAKQQQRRIAGCCCCCCQLPFSRQNWVSWVRQTQANRERQQTAWPRSSQQRFASHHHDRFCSHFGCCCGCCFEGNLGPTTAGHCALAIQMNCCWCCCCYHPVALAHCCATAAAVAAAAVAAVRVRGFRRRLAP